MKNEKRVKNQERERKESQEKEKEKVKKEVLDRNTWEERSISGGRKAKEEKE